MLELPEKLTPDGFLRKHWQKQALFIPGALPRVQPAVTRNELAWLATLDDIESRIVFVDRQSPTPQYRVENGPFDEPFLQNLPKRDWTLLVHDVEKHLPAMRVLLGAVPFIPDWRIDDLMVSFAAPGGGVGPHRDNYDVFLCQGIGIRQWCFSHEFVDSDPGASKHLALLKEFSGADARCVQGDVLYLPPGTAHWGTATRASITYSIGMRAPQASDLSSALQCQSPHGRRFYDDSDLRAEEAHPGYISRSAIERAADLMMLTEGHQIAVGKALGLFATQPKGWLTPECAASSEVDEIAAAAPAGVALHLHGMTRIAFDDQRLYVNGASRPLRAADQSLVKELCATRQLKRGHSMDNDMLRWLLLQGGLELFD